MKNIISIIILIQAVTQAADEKFKDFPSFSRDGVSIYKNIDGVDFDPGLPKKISFVPVEKVVETSEKFLQKTFGGNFIAPIKQVSFERHLGDGGVFVWCWVITYFDPNTLHDIDTVQIFHVYLDVAGELLMEVRQKE